MAGTVLYELDEHVATITYNRPDARNAINAELRRDLNAAWERFRTLSRELECTAQRLRDWAASWTEVNGFMAIAYDLYKVALQRLQDLTSFERVIPTRVVADSDVIWSGSRVPDSVPV